MPGSSSYRPSHMDIQRRTNLLETMMKPREHTRAYNQDDPVMPGSASPIRPVNPFHNGPNGMDISMAWKYPNQPNKWYGMELGEWDAMKHDERLKRQQDNPFAGPMDAMWFGGRQFL